VSERLVFDGDCGFCTTSATWLAHGDRVDTVPWQFLDLASVGLTVAQVSSSVWWLVDDRPVEHSSRAIGRALLLRTRLQRRLEVDHPLLQRRVGRGQDPHRQQPGVPGAADRHRRDRHAGRP
jgi:hypothetical protein